MMYSRQSLYIINIILYIFESSSFKIRNYYDFGVLSLCMFFFHFYDTTYVIQHVAESVTARWVACLRTENPFMLMYTIRSSEAYIHIKREICAAWYTLHTNSYDSCLSSEWHFTPKMFCADNERYIWVNAHFVWSQPINIGNKVYGDACDKSRINVVAFCICRLE